MTISTLDLKGEYDMVGNDDWTFPTLKEYTDHRLSSLKENIDQRFSDNTVAVGAALTAQKETSNKSEEATDKRFDQVMDNVDKRFDQMSEIGDRNHQELMLRISGLEANMNQRLGGASASQRFSGMLLPIVLAVMAAAEGLFITIYK